MGNIITEAELFTLFKEILKRLESIDKTLTALLRDKVESSGK